MITKIKKELNQFFSLIKFKKQYTKNLKKKKKIISDLANNNYKTFNSLLFSNFSIKNNGNNYLISYIIDIIFLKSNTFLHIMDYSGKMKFFYSAGFFKYAGKNKKSRFFVLKDFYKVLTSNKLQFLKNKPIALHLKNVNYKKFWIIKKLKEKFFIKSISNYNFYPYNGCRKSKVRRKKF